MICGSKRFFKTTFSFLVIFLLQNCFCSACFVGKERFYNTIHKTQSIIPVKFESIKRSIMGAWTILDLMRSMQMKKEERTEFVLKMLEDVTSILAGISELKGCKSLCPRFCAMQEGEIEKLKELLAEFLDIFQSIFVYPDCSDECALFCILSKCADIISEF